jgi:hypothetical protein
MLSLKKMTPATYVPETLTAHTPIELHSQTKEVQAKEEVMEKKGAGAPSLLDLPFEIRLRIYDYVLACHPVRNAHLSSIASSRPGLSHPGMKYNASDSSLGIECGISCPTAQKTSTVAIISLPLLPSGPISLHSVISSLRASYAFSTQNKLPTGLLASCAQIYHEARFLPWQSNTWTYVSWFRSGIHAARQFSLGIQAWQREAMRWVGIELVGDDLWENGSRGAVDEEREWVGFGSERKG